MDKKHNYTNHGKSSKRLWITFLFFCIITTGFMQAANKVFAQATVTASFKNATLSEILWEIQRQTDFTFVYSTNDVKQIKVQNLNVNNEKIANVLDKCLMNSGLTSAACKAFHTQMPRSRRGPRRASGISSGADAAASAAAGERRPDETKENMKL